MAKVQFLPVAEHLRPAGSKGLPSCRLEGKKRPVGVIDHVSVFYDPPGKIRIDAVIHTAEVRSRIVDAVCDGAGK